MFVMVPEYIGKTRRQQRVVEALDVVLDSIAGMRKDMMHPDHYLKTVCIEGVAITVSVALLDSTWHMLVGFSLVSKPYVRRMFELSDSQFHGLVRKAKSELKHEVTYED